LDVCVSIITVVFLIFRRHELKHAEDIVKPPNQKHSVKGLGETEPDPEEVHTSSDGVLVPYGKPVESKKSNSSLLYNEYELYLYSLFIWYTALIVLINS